MKAREIAAVIEDFAPLDIQEGWDNSGFCIGSPESEVKGVIVAFDCTPELIDEAVEVGANMVITHHPLIFKGVRRIDSNTFLGSIITKAIKHDIIVYAAHTNADKVISGVSGLMAERLSLRDIEPLEDGGLGIVGNLSTPLSANEFIVMLKDAFSLESVRVSRPIDCMIERVALCGGSGSSLIADAVNRGAQVYISGDISYHNFFTERDFMVMDIGHYESEIDIVDKIISLLKEKLGIFAVYKARNNNNPIYYF